MYNHILHELECDLAAIADVNPSSAPIDGLVATHHELLREPDDHIVRKDDPQRLRLDHGVAEGPGLGVDEVVVGGVGDHVDLAVSAAGGALGEP